MTESIQPKINENVGKNAAQFDQVTFDTTFNPKTGGATLRDRAYTHKKNTGPF